MSYQKIWGDVIGYHTFIRFSRGAIFYHNDKMDTLKKCGSLKDINISCTAFDASPTSENTKEALIDTNDGLVLSCQITTDPGATELMYSNFLTQHQL